MAATELIPQHGPNCWICGLVCDFRRPVKGGGAQKRRERVIYRAIKATRDHELPKSMGGNWDSSNIRLAHGHCNSVRGSAPMSVEFAKMCREWMIKNIPRSSFDSAADYYNKRFRPEWVEQQKVRREPEPEPDWWSQQIESKHCEDAMYRRMQGGLCNGK